MKKRSLYRENTIVTDYTPFEVYIERWLNVFYARFGNENLPEEIIQYDIERMLFEHGRVIFTYDEMAEKYVCLPPASDNGARDIYGKPTSWTLRGLGTESYLLENIPPSKCVEIRNNPLGGPSMPHFLHLVRRLYEIERIISINVNAQKMPVWFRCNEKDKFSLKNLINSWKGAEPFIFTSKAIDINNVGVLNAQAPFVADKLYAMYTKCLNELLIFGGFSVVQNEKGAQMNSAEVNFGMGNVYANRDAFMQPRQWAVEQINKKWGLNLEIKFNDAIIENIQLLKTEGVKPNDATPEGVESIKKGGNSNEV